MKTTTKIIIGIVAFIFAAAIAAPLVLLKKSDMPKEVLTFRLTGETDTLTLEPFAILNNVEYNAPLRYFDANDNTTTYRIPLMLTIREDSTLSAPQLTCDKAWIESIRTEQRGDTLTMGLDFSHFIDRNMKADPESGFNPPVNMPESSMILGELAVPAGTLHLVDNDVYSYVFEFSGFHNADLTLKGLNQFTLNDSWFTRLEVR